MARTVLEPVVRWILAALFLWAGISKLARPDLFAAAIDNYRLLPYSAAVALAYMLPWFEIMTGAGLLVKRLMSGAALCAGFLFTLFFLALLQALIRGLDIDCGCFGTLGEPGRYSLMAALVRAAAGLAAARWIFHTNEV